MKVKTHLIVTDQYDDIVVKWVKYLRDTKPIFDRNGYPIFIVIGQNGRTEMHTFNLNEVEQIAKRILCAKGRASVTYDQSRIYIKTKSDEELIGVVTLTHTRKYAPMYDEV